MLESLLRPVLRQIDSAREQGESIMSMEVSILAGDTDWHYKVVPPRRTDAYFMHAMCLLLAREKFEDPSCQDQYEYPLRWKDDEQGPGSDAWRDFVDDAQDHVKAYYLDLKERMIQGYKDFINMKGRRDMDADAMVRSLEDSEKTSPSKFQELQEWAGIPATYLQYDYMVEMCQGILDIRVEPGAQDEGDKVVIQGVCDYEAMTAPGPTRHDPARLFAQWCVLEQDEAQVPEALLVRNIRTPNDHRMTPSPQEKYFKYRMATQLMGMAVNLLQDSRSTLSKQSSQDLDELRRQFHDARSKGQSVQEVTKNCLGAVDSTLAKVDKLSGLIQRADATIVHLVKEFYAGSWHSGEDQEDATWIKLGQWYRTMRALLDQDCMKGHDELQNFLVVGLMAMGMPITDYGLAQFHAMVHRGAVQDVARTLFQKIYRKFKFDQPGRWSCQNFRLPGLSRRTGWIRSSPRSGRP